MSWEPLANATRVVGAALCLVGAAIRRGAGCSSSLAVVDQILDAWLFPAYALVVVT